MTLKNSEFKEAVSRNSVCTARFLLKSFGEKSSYHSVLLGYWDGFCRNSVGIFTDFHAGVGRPPPFNGILGRKAVLMTASSQGSLERDTPWTGHRTPFTHALTPRDGSGPPVKLMFLEFVRTCMENTHAGTKRGGIST